MINTKLALGIALMAFGLYLFYNEFSHVETVTINLSRTKYWGSPKRTPIPPGHMPFRIRYGPEVIEDLRRKLADDQIVVHQPLDNVGFRYGFNSKTLKKVIKYWRDDYLKRWEEREDYLNKFPQFTTEVQGLNIHFIHAKPAKKVPTVPLLLLHGWPGSVREFYEIIPMLTDPPAGKPAFEVIAPSLPGYGWSESTNMTGLGPAEAAVIMRNLMFKLGHHRFVVQGGDWGSIIGSHIATLYKDNVMGYHSNMCGSLTFLAHVKGFIASFWPSWFIAPENEDFIYPQSEKFLFLIEEMGYFHLQATRPDTIGIALANNPIGLAAYILEKFSTWTNAKYRERADGGLFLKYSKDTLLDNIMIYYLSNSITTSMRLYSEAFTASQRAFKLERIAVKVPVGCGRFRNDLSHAMDWQLREKYPILIHSTYNREGGHFIAMESPKALYTDFMLFYGKLLSKMAYIEKQKKENAAKQ